MSMFPIATSTVSNSTTTTVTFSNIPQTYTHLEIRGFFNNINAVAGNSTYIQFNGDTGTNYTGHYVLGTGSGTGSGFYGASGTWTWFGNYPTNISNTYATTIASVLDYTNTNKYKAIRLLNGYDSNTNNIQAVWMFTGLWMSTSAITSITLSVTGAGNYWTSGSRFDLYGLSTSSATGA